MQICPFSKEIVTSRHLRKTERHSPLFPFERAFLVNRQIKPNTTIINLIGASTSRVRQRKHTQKGTRGRGSSIIDTCEVSQHAVSFSVRPPPPSPSRWRRTCVTVGLSRYTLLRAHFRRRNCQIASRGLQEAPRVASRRGISSGLNKSVGRALTPGFTAARIFIASLGFLGKLV